MEQAEIGYDLGPTCEKFLPSNAMNSSNKHLLVMLAGGMITRNEAMSSLKMSPQDKYNANVNCGIAIETVRKEIEKRMECFSPRAQLSMIPAKATSTSSPRRARHMA